MALKITIFGRINRFAAKFLTRWENYEKESISEKMFSLKFLFLQCVNNFSIGIYIVFYRVNIFYNNSTIQKNVLTRIIVTMN